MELLDGLNSFRDCGEKVQVGGGGFRYEVFSKQIDLAVISYPYFLRCWEKWYEVLCMVFGARGAHIILSCNNVGCGCFPRQTLCGPLLLWLCI